MSEINNVIENIANNISKKPILSLCKKISKKCSFKSAKDLANLVDLATWLYIYGYNSDTLEICNLINDTTFNGNYTLWDNIDILYCIKARILRENNSLAEAKEIIDYVNQYRVPHLYENLVEWFTDTLDINIRNATEQFNSKSLAISWRLVKLQSAIKYKEAGNFPISNDKLEKTIIEQISFLSN